MSKNDVRKPTELIVPNRQEDGNEVTLSSRQFNSVIEHADPISRWKTKTSVANRAAAHAGNVMVDVLNEQADAQAAYEKNRIQVISDQKNVELRIYANEIEEQQLQLESDRQADLLNVAHDETSFVQLSSDVRNLANMAHDGVIEERYARYIAQQKEDATYAAFDERREAIRTRIRNSNRNIELKTR